MPGNQYRVIFITAPSIDVAKKLAKTLVEEKLAACCNLIGAVKSVYRWNGKVCEDPEAMMIVKTEKSLVKKVIARVVENHPYEVPEVISLPIEDGNPAYMKWLGASVAAKPKSAAARRGK